MDIQNNYLYRKLHVILYFALKKVSELLQLFKGRDLFRKLND